MSLFQRVSQGPWSHKNRSCLQLCENSIDDLSDVVRLVRLWVHPIYWKHHSCLVVVYYHTKAWTKCSQVIGKLFDAINYNEWVDVIDPCFWDECMEHWVVPGNPCLCLFLQIFSLVLIAPVNTEFKEVFYSNSGKHAIERSLMYEYLLLLTFAWVTH